MWFQTRPKTKSKPNPGAGTNRLPLAGPRYPGKRTRREDHVLLIVRDEFRTGYSSIGLLASRARLRFTGIAIIKRWTAGRKRIIIERHCVFSLVSHARGSPHSSVFICG